MAVSVRLIDAARIMAADLKAAALPHVVCVNFARDNITLEVDRKPVATLFPRSDRVYVDVVIEIWARELEKLKTEFMGGGVGHGIAL